MSELTAPQQYIYEHPQTVEACQWLPDDQAAAEKMLWWLVRRGAKFQHELSDEVIQPDHYLSFYSQSQKCYAFYASAGDWVVRKSPRNFEVVENEDFESLYRRKGDDDD